MTEPSIPAPSVSGAPAMEPDGFYNRHSQMQASGIAAVLPSWRDLCRTVALDDDQTTVVVDYGSSQGRNSFTPLKIAIDEVRSRGRSNQPIEIFHTDLPSNDFSSLFAALEEDPASYLAGTEAIYPAAIGRSFFDVLLPPGRVHLGWSSWAMQWMSRLPAEAPDHVIAGMSQVPEVIEAVHRQQTDDWRRLLEARSVEMRPGGRLLCAFTGRRETSGWEWLCGGLWEAIRDLQREGLLTETELRRITIPICLRTQGDLLAPFMASGEFSGLTMDRAEVVSIADPVWDDFLDDGDRQRLAKRHADVTRAWSGPVIARALPPDRDRNGLLDAIFGRLAARLAENPQKHEPFLAVATLTKRSASGDQAGLSRSTGQEKSSSKGASLFP